MDHVRHTGERAVPCTQRPIGDRTIICRTLAHRRGVPLSVLVAGGKTTCVCTRAKQIGDHAPVDGHKNGCFQSKVLRKMVLEGHVEEVVEQTLRRLVGIRLST